MSAVIQKITKSDQKVALLSAKLLADSEDQAIKDKDEVITETWITTWDNGN